MRFFGPTLPLLSACVSISEALAPSALHNQRSAISALHVATDDHIQIEGDTLPMESNDNRVFVADISATSTERSLTSTFAQFGPVHDVTIIGTHRQTKKRKRSTYCFITFTDATSAQRAISSSTPTEEYKEIRPAKPLVTRVRSNASRAREEERLLRIKQLGKMSNLIVQAQSSHLDRFVHYLERNNKLDITEMPLLSDEDRNCEVLGSTKTNSKNVSLLYLSCKDPIEFSRKLNNDLLLARAINKTYIVHRGLLEGNLSTSQGCNDFAQMLCEKYYQSSDDVNQTRLQVFPPRFQPCLLQSLGTVTKQTNKFISKSFTHMLSVVEVYKYNGRGRANQHADNEARLYMVGTFPAAPQTDVFDTNNMITSCNDGDEVSRAYYKLEEAIATYEEIKGNLPPEFHKSVAVDCGSAPGGWTKCLIEHFGCRVYSIDPGALDPSVLEMKETRHIQAKIQDALPLLLKDTGAAGKVKIWVSDMCLHNMSDQVDLLLRAKESGLLASKSFFVLTLKCIAGHSKEAYNAQVERAVDKLRAIAPVDDVQTYHLFSNRSGERTVTGYMR
ncbi:hypothetical protein ACHAWF_004184 [Thalassiosira exigua]